MPVMGKAPPLSPATHCVPVDRASDMGALCLRLRPHCVPRPSAQVIVLLFTTSPKNGPWMAKVPRHDHYTSP